MRTTFPLRARAAIWTSRPAEGSDMWARKGVGARGGEGRAKEGTGLELGWSARRAMERAAAASDVVGGQSRQHLASLAL